MKDESQFFVKTHTIELSQLYTGWTVKVSQDSNFRVYAFSTASEALKFTETVMSYKE